MIRWSPMWQQMVSFECNFSWNLFCFICRELDGKGKTPFSKCKMFNISLATIDTLDYASLNMSKYRQSLSEIGKFTEYWLQTIFSKATKLNITLFSRTSHLKLKSNPIRNNYYYFYINFSISKHHIYMPNAYAFILDRSVIYAIGWYDRLPYEILTIWKSFRSGPNVIACDGCISIC